MSINNIPLSSELPSYFGYSTSVGRLEYFLEAKALAFEDIGQYDLLLAYLKKAKELKLIIPYPNRRRAFLRYIRKLIKYGFVEQAIEEKKSLDLIFGDYLDDKHMIPLNYTIINTLNEELDESERLYKLEYMEWVNIIDNEIVAYNKRLEYSILKNHYPEIMPKSQSAYTLAKKRNTAKYQEILKRVESDNLEIPYIKLDKD